MAYCITPQGTKEQGPSFSVAVSIGLTGPYFPCKISLVASVVVQPKVYNMGNHHSKKPNFKDLIKGIHISTKELDAWYENFKKDFRDGKIDKQEFQILYQKYFPADPTKEFCDQVFKRYDTDGSGFIDFREFMTTLIVGSSGSTTEKLLWVFKFYDKNNNGYLLESEIRDILTAVYKSKDVPDANNKAAQTAKKIMDKADDTRDRKLSEAEFIQHFNDCPEIMDMFKND